MKVRRGGKPGVLKSLLSSNPWLLSLVQQPRAKVLSLLAHIFPMSLQKLNWIYYRIFLNFLRVNRVERKVTAEHQIDNISIAPNIYFQRVRFLRYYLRSNIAQSSKSHSRSLTRSQLYTKSKIYNFNFSLLRDQYIFRLDVTVGYPKGVEVGHAFADFWRDWLCCRFWDFEVFAA